MWYITGVLDYISTEYDTDWDRKYFQVTPEMAHYLEECYSTLMCYPNAAGGFVELFKINVK
jgi:hypothetical protein